ncbi:GntR family transcriptional regulator [Mycolicibacterium murale]|nr:GntR family transcriptional regulator [Mycolicibacterium murale]MCV7182581.1 GntR family transcriptional regulator [Mycolicibacterium murale]
MYPQRLHPAATEEALSMASESTIAALAGFPELTASASLPSRLHEILEAAIIAGTLTPGQRIHADEIAGFYGISRIPVREALRSLHQDGWVEIKPRYGVRVRGRTLVELDELFEFRAELEACVARFAAERRTDAELRAMHDATARSAKARDDLDYAELDLCASLFYSALRQACHNSVLERESATMEKRARFYFSTVADRLGVDWTFVHEKLLGHVEAGEADAAGALARHHIRNTGEAVRSLLF